ncbi:deoxyribose-phosphate aldolase [Aquimarina sp. MMG015]|uniref:deoxyribose-phosphate aldolase n=1 Tax=unclassified Aquimarina TaxID=2627091 RepID=UPI000E5427A9|nr:MULTISPECIES: deoxyribose-phosphate aldolase [unclassified Aquimarina]AXT58216.1 deoxyribose-phosphate aldolase [Aquimarina sp. AD1]MBQ4804959.1 deoxyribose-phosphate aldolase [Aquimarina sp. MMG015]RKN12280.1 deoxyribose-phosphate aldolase [Aquimarina sp. AD1]
MKLNQYIDHTLLKPTATVEDIKKLCTEAKRYGFYSVCVNGAYVGLACSELMKSDIKIAAVVGFPLGAMTTKAKVFEAKQCIDDGANEIDMVLNIGLLKSGYHKIVQDEIALIKKAIGDNVLKVILENSYLTEEEKKIACQLSIDAGADFIKTSTGFGDGGATLGDIRLMKEIAMDAIQIKASGGIRDAKTAVQYINMGVSRLGTSSSVALVTSK